MLRNITKPLDHCCFRQVQRTINWKSRGRLARPGSYTRWIKATDFEEESNCPLVGRAPVNVRLVKTSEPPHHDTWKYSLHHSDQTFQKNLRKFLVHIGQGDLSETEQRKLRNMLLDGLLIVPKVKLKQISPLHEKAFYPALAHMYESWQGPQTHEQDDSIISAVDEYDEADDEHEPEPTMKPSLDESEGSCGLFPLPDPSEGTRTSFPQHDQQPNEEFLLDEDERTWTMQDSVLSVVHESNQNDGSSNKFTDGNSQNGQSELANKIQDLPVNDAYVMGLKMDTVPDVTNASLDTRFLKESTGTDEISSYEKECTDNTNPSQTLTTETNGTATFGVDARSLIRDQKTAADTQSVGRSLALDIECNAAEFPNNACCGFEATDAHENLSGNHVTSGENQGQNHSINTVHTLPSSVITSPLPQTQTAKIPRFSYETIGNIKIVPQVKGALDPVEDSNNLAETEPVCPAEELSISRQVMHEQICKPVAKSRMDLACENALNRNLPNSQQYRERRNICNYLQHALRKHFHPLVKLTLFGSSRNGFTFRDSDLDICLSYEGDILNCTTADMVKDIARILTKLHRVRDVRPIPNAKVPIIKFYLPNERCEADISLFNKLALRNTHMLSCYANIDKRCRTLGYMLKSIAKRNNVCSPTNNTLSSYAYVILVIYFLQQTDPPVLPVLQELYEGEESPENIVDGWNSWFYDDMINLSSVWDGRGKNSKSVGTLWQELLRFYNEEFDFKNEVVCVRRKERLSKDGKVSSLLASKLKRWDGRRGLNMLHWRSRSMYIEDPFLLTHNLAAMLTLARAERVTASVFNPALGIE